MLRARAPAKVNLTLHVLGRRADGFHELASLVAFAGCAADVVSLAPGRRLGLASVDGPFASAAGANDDNLVLKAARAAAERIEGLAVGMFSLTKRIPVAAGLGGGSADAGAALRLIAEANGLAADDPRLVEAAAATGSDVPACLVSRAALMTGRGEGVAPLELPPLAAVLANPMKGLATAEVFRGLGLGRGEAFAYEPPPREGSALACLRDAAFHLSPVGRGRPEGPGEGASSSQDDARPPHPLAALATSPHRGEVKGGGLPAEVASGRNDLEPPARALLPEIGEGLDALAASEGCLLSRMSGSGATVFGLYDDQRTARRAARALRQRLPGWWILPTLLR